MDDHVMLFILIPVAAFAAVIIGLLFLMAVLSRRAKPAQEYSQNLKLKTNKAGFVLALVLALAYTAFFTIQLIKVFVSDNLFGIVLGISIVLYSLYNLVLLILTYSNAGLLLDNEKITYQNPLRRQKQIAWEDVQYVKKKPFGQLLVGGINKEILISSQYSGYVLGCDVVRQRRPDLFPRA